MATDWSGFSSTARGGSGEIPPATEYESTLTNILISVSKQLQLKTELKGNMMEFENDVLHFDGALIYVVYPQPSVGTTPI